MAVASKLEEARIDLSLCKANHSNPTLQAFLAKHRNNKIPTGRRISRGARPFCV